MRNFKFIPNKNNSIYDLTPLLDIIFITLIFIFLSANFYKKSQIKLPLYKNSNTYSYKKSILNIEITKDNKIFYNKKEIDSTRFVAILKTANYKKLIINADKKIELQNLLNFIKIIKSQNIKNYSIACENR